VWTVTNSDGGRAFHICLDDALHDSISRDLGLGKNALLICRDVALDDDMAANLALQCRLKLI
jgi:adenine-specific DNA-methyltransferase